MPALATGNRLDIRIRIPWWAKVALEDADTDTFWVTGGLGSGKTYGATVWFLSRCFQNNQSRFSWAIAPTHAKVRDILIPTFHDVLFEHFGMVHRRDYEVFITQPPKLVFQAFPHEIHFHSGARPDLMIGTNISHYLVTEVGTQNFEVFEKVQSRTRCPKAQVRQGMLEGTPEGMNWYQERADMPTVAGIGYNPETKAKRFKLWTADNTHLPADYVEKLTRTYAYDPAKLRSYLYGDFIPFTKGTAYWEFFHSRNVTLGLEPSMYLPILLAWDFNKTPLAWVAMQRQVIERRGVRTSRFVALHESDGKARGIMDACAEFIAKFPPAKFRDIRIEVYGDPSGYAGSHLSASCGYDQIKQYLAPYYSNVVIAAARKAPTIQARLERHNALMAYEQFVVAAWCRNLIKSLTETSLKDGLWEIKKPDGEDWSHWADAVGYPLFQLTKTEDLEAPLRPKRYGVNA